MFAASGNKQVHAMSDPAPPRKGGKLKVLIFTAVLAGAAGAGAFFFLGGDHATAKEAGAEASETASEDAAGPVVLLDPVTLSLADGHYLKVGLALQLAPGEGAAAGGGHAESDEPAMSAEETAQALDVAITLFGARTMDQLHLPDERADAKADLVRALKKAYDGRVTDVYFTAFAMQ